MFRGFSVAVKVMKIESKSTVSQSISRQFRDELEILQICYHENIVPLLAYQDDPTFPLCLVYPWMENVSDCVVYSCSLSLSDILIYFIFSPFLTKQGSLHGVLSDRTKSEHLTWRKRVEIVRDACSAIEYLHSEKDGKPIILHRDIKSKMNMMSLFFTESIMFPLSLRIQARTYFLMEK